MDSEKEAFTNADLAPKAIIAFFPFAFSSVCTDQFTLYENELVSELADAGVTLYGVSTDAVDSQSAFKEKLGFSFDLLSDFEPKGETAKKFGAYFEPAGMTNRALVAIADGEVRWSWLGDTPGHLPGPELIREAISAL